MNQPTEYPGQLKNILATVLLVLILQGCTSSPTHKQWQHAIKAGYWQAEGKIGLIYNGQGQQANFDWKNHNHNYTIALFGPLGQGRVELSKNGDTYRATNEKTEHQAPSAEALLEEMLGWSLPVSGLQYWILGQSNPLAAIELAQNDNIGRLQRLKQQGWTIDFSHQSEQDQQSELPRKIIAKRDNLKLTVVIKRWQALAAHGI